MDHIEPRPAPEDDPNRAMPGGGGWISGSSVTTPAGGIVPAAIAALQAFGGSLTRDQAAALLGMWARRHDLTPLERAQVLDAFRSDR